MLTFMTVRELYEMACSGSTMETDQIEYAQLQGWVRTNSQQRFDRVYRAERWNVFPQRSACLLVRSGQFSGCIQISDRHGADCYGESRTDPAGEAAV